METSRDPELVRGRPTTECDWYGSEAFGGFLSDSVRHEDAEELPDAGGWQGREAMIGRLNAAGEGVQVVDVIHLVAVEGGK